MKVRTSSATTTAALAARDASLRAQLVAHRRELESKIRDTLSSSRAARPAQRYADGVDEAEASDAEVQDDIAFSLLEAQAEAIARIDEAVRRLDEGRYGQCRQCGSDIAESRLRALPFATRCVECERRREGGRQWAAAPTPRHQPYERETRPLTPGLE